jgi:hypothetical protein
MRRSIRFYLKWCIFPLMVFLCVFGFTPQKATTLTDCCKQYQCFTIGDWTSMGSVECPNNPGNYCNMKKRSWYCSLSDCERVDICPIGIDYCRFSSSYDYVIYEYPDCTGEVTDEYDEIEIIKPCATSDTCFANCQPDENPLNSTSKGDCP